MRPSIHKNSALSLTVKYVELNGFIHGCFRYTSTRRFVKTVGKPRKEMAYILGLSPSWAVYILKFIRDRLFSVYYDSAEQWSIARLFTSTLNTFARWFFCHLDMTHVCAGVIRLICNTNLMFNLQQCWPRSVRDRLVSETNFPPRGSWEISR